MAVNQGYLDSNYTTNFARITSLLMREGTDRMKDVTLQNLPSRQTLSQALQNNESTLKYLRGRKILSRVQYNILFPFQGDASVIDMTMWMILARNITVKPNGSAINWNKSPRVNEITWQHDFVRLKEIRNYLFHASSPDITEQRYNAIKYELVATLKRLGSDDTEIERLISRDLDPQQTAVYSMQIKQQYMEEKMAAIAEKKRESTIMFTVISLLSVGVLCALCFMVYWFVSQRAPCQGNIRQLSAGNGEWLDFMTREGWGAHDSNSWTPVEKLRTPVKMAVLFQTGTARSDCTITNDCCQVVKRLQLSRMHTGCTVCFQDIELHYLIGNDGVVYEGRPSKYRGASVWGRNDDMVSIAILGDYSCTVPSRPSLVALYVLLEYLVYDDPMHDGQDRKPVLANDFKLYGHCQVNIVAAEHNVTFPHSPGAGIMREIKFWNHWRNDNVTECEVTKDCLTSIGCCGGPCSSH